MSTNLILTDREPLGEALRRAAQAALGPKATIYTMTYHESIALLTSRRSEETDFAILELFRIYAGGNRAEGLVLAERWKHQRPSLIVSPLHVARELACPGYWDPSDPDPLVDRIRWIAAFPGQANEGRGRLLNHFRGSLDVPPQHS